MPIWQNHEQRITTLEVTTANIKNEFTEIKDKIDRGNTEQSKKLEIIDKRLMDEFFKRKNRNHENIWKLIRSEEHTSELQSRFDLVCRLLLEKKKSKST